MNRMDFLRGWILLTTQPWGKPYRMDGPQGQESGPPAGKIQRELYWDTFKPTFPPLWIETCKTLATGSHWPSISEIKTALGQIKTAKPEMTPPPATPQITGPKPQFMTKEEFGLDLFEAITLCGRILAAREHLAATVHSVSDQRRRKQAEADLPVLTAQLPKALAKLPEDQVMEILEKYPWIRDI